MGAADRLNLTPDENFLPDTDIEHLELGNFINAEDIQSVMDDFYRLTGMGIGIIDLRGNVIVGTGWQDVCTRFHRVNPQTLQNCIESDLFLTKNVPDGEIFAYKCKNNMWDMVTPIFIGSKHLGNIFFGQFFYEDEEPDYDQFMAQAEKYGFDRDEYLSAVRQAPRFSREKVSSLMSFYAKFAGVISKLGYSNLKLSKSTFEIQRREMELRQAKEELERRVAERTIELHKANERLHTELEERKHLEEEVRRHRDHLEELVKQRSSELIEAQRIGHMGNWDWNIIDNKLEWSDEVYRIFGLEPRQFGATYDAFLKCVHPGDRVAVQKGVDNALHKAVAYSLDHRIVLPDGSERVVHEQAQVYFDNSGSPIRMIGTVQDITERKQAEETQKKLNKELMKYNVQLEAVNKELEAFSYSASHVMKAPLRAINSFSQILLTDYYTKIDSEGQRLLKILYENSITIGRYIEDILEYSEIGRKAAKMSDLDMEVIVKEALRELDPGTAERDLRMFVKTLPSAWGDRYMIKKVFLNLLSNAIKFTRDKKTAIVEIGGSVDKDTNTYYIKDNGAGFDMRHKGKLFGVFQRLHGDDEFEGTGMGLAIVQLIVNKHNGLVWAEGKTGEGATFYFTLPGTQRDWRITRQA